MSVNQIDVDLSTSAIVLAGHGNLFDSATNVPFVALLDGTIFSWQWGKAISIAEEEPKMIAIAFSADRSLIIGHTQTAESREYLMVVSSIDGSVVSLRTY